MESTEETARDRPVRALLRQADFLRLWLVGAFANAMRWLELLASACSPTSSRIPRSPSPSWSRCANCRSSLSAPLPARSPEAVNRKVIVMLALIVPAVVSTVLASLATMGHLELWHIAVGNFVSGTMWSTEMSTRRRMVGEVAGPQRIVPAIALDSTTNAAPA